MNVLVIGDLHCPATRVGYLEFTKEIYKKYKCDTVLFIGDVVDWHAISFHAREPSLPGPRDEYELAKTYIKEWAKAYPKAKVCLGNHDERPTRLAKSVSIPDFMLKSYAELWETPQWEWSFNFNIDDVHYRHGTGITGIHPAWNLMNKVKCNVVIGHCHSRCGIKWSVNPFRRFFAMDVGSGIDEKAWQFAYGRDLVERPIISCGVVLDGMPYIEVMPMSRGEKYHDSKFKKKVGSDTKYKN